MSDISTYSSNVWYLDLLSSDPDAPAPAGDAPPPPKDDSDSDSEADSWEDSDWHPDITRYIATFIATQDQIIYICHFIYR